MRGGWQVTPIARGSEVTIWWEFVPKSRMLAPLLVALFGYQADRDFPRIIQRIGAQARGESPGARAGSRPAAPGRIVPISC